MVHGIKPKEKPKSPHGDADKLAAKSASAKLRLGDVRGALHILSSDRSYIAPDDACLALLRARHPHAPKDRRPAPLPATDSLTCSVPQLLMAIKSFGHRRALMAYVHSTFRT